MQSQRNITEYLQVVTVVNRAGAQKLNKLPLGVSVDVCHVLFHESHRLEDLHIVVALSQVVVQATAHPRREHLRVAAQNERGTNRPIGGWSRLRFRKKSVHYARAMYSRIDQKGHGDTAEAEGTEES